MADFTQSTSNTLSQLPHSSQSTEVQPTHTGEEFNGSHRGSSSLDREPSTERQRGSTMSQSQTLVSSRGGTLKKRRSLSRRGSLRREGSRKGSRPGSSRGIGLDGQDDLARQGGSEMNSAFYTPVTTTGSPTEILATRFQGWRKVLKDLITYFRDIQKSYDVRSKSLYTLSNVINNISHPPVFLAQGGIGDATAILRTYHKQAISEGNKAKTIEDEVIAQLTGLRSDLQQKVKEIRGLAGDFKNNVDKEVEATKRAVQELQIALGHAAADPSAPSGKGDPFIVKIGVERQLQRQIDEENYLHRAFLNLESSGRELESIVIGEIQKAYHAYAAILRREADEAYYAIEKLEAGPLGMPKEHEWDAFVNDNEYFVDPRLPVRRIEDITYPGRDNPAASEVRSGMLERKSKYLKSYTPGWYVLSPSHLHEFKSPDRITSQSPLMSLHLPDQKLGSHSNTESSSHKFMIKGRQSGGVHRGHAWVFRAESHDTMLAWYEDMKNLTEKTGEERTAFIRAHARSISAGSNKALSISDDGAMDEDEADQVPYSATASQQDLSPVVQHVERPDPGGRFPSTITTDRNSQVVLPPSSPSSSEDPDHVARSDNFPGPPVPDNISNRQEQIGGDGAIPETSRHLETHSPNDHTPIAQTHEYNSLLVNKGSLPAEFPGSEYYTNPVGAEGVSSDGPGLVSYGAQPPPQPPIEATPRPFVPQPSRHDSTYGDWMAPAAGAGGLAFGAGSVAAYKHHQEPKGKEREMNGENETGPVQPLERTGFDPDANFKSTRHEPERTGIEAVFHPTTGSTSTPPIPSNAAWATESASSVVEPNQIIYSDGTTPRAADTRNPIDPFVAQSPGQISDHTGPDDLSRDPAAPIKALANRPALTSHDSIVTISDLHVPGEYPRTNLGPTEAWKELLE